MQLSYYMKRFGSTYYWGNLFFPKKIKNDVYTLYAFVRSIDEVVDNPSADMNHAKSQLSKMKEQFEQIYKSTKVSDPYESFLETAELFHRKAIPLERANSFFDAMIQDTYKSRYHSYQELQKYMYGSAEVVGMMMCKLIGCDEHKALPYAKKLSEAMQYTNILRDIKEDYNARDRIYIPADRLKMCGLTHQDIGDQLERNTLDKRTQAFLAQELALCRSLYTEANIGIQYLAKHGRLPVWIASRLYEAILDKLEKNKYNINKDSATSRRGKLGVLALSLYKHAIYQKTY